MAVVRRCQHCYRDITQLPNGHWMDGDGIMVCKKKIGDEDFLMHTPLPQVTR